MVFITKDYSQNFKFESMQRQYVVDLQRKRILLETKIQALGIEKSLSVLERNRSVLEIQMLIDECQSVLETTLNHLNEAYHFTYFPCLK